MSFTNIFWIFLILTALQPALKQRLLFASRARLMRRREQSAAR
jgi:hypothetical protein